MKTPRPYCWMGEMHDAHIQDWRDEQCRQQAIANAKNAWALAQATSQLIDYEAMRQSNYSLSGLQISAKLSTKDRFTSALLGGASPFGNF